MDRSRDWATRIAHEASLHEENSFLTLTYSDASLPDDYSVSARPLQLFMKRLRRAIAPMRCRFFACGEYGDDNGRPHYHAIIFGFGFPDRTVWRKSNSGHLLYRSALLERCWWNLDRDEPLGHCEIGTVNRQSGGYVARYVIKKIGGDAAVDHYQRVHPVTGELCWVNPEFSVCSTRPGIGHAWYEKYKSDAFPSDFVVHDGQKVSVPRYYTRKLKAEHKATILDPYTLVPKDEFSNLRRKRQANAVKHAEDNTDERLAVRSECAQLRLDRLKRELDNGE